MSKLQKLKVIISGGGTGGHIFPAIAIADTLKRKVEDIEILFIGAKDKMEMQKVPAAGYPIEGLWISGLQRKLTLRNLSFPFKVVSSLLKAGKLISRFQPDVVVGVGGFASGPTLRAASSRKIPTLIQEQNSYPGITNKLLSRRVNKICVAYDGMERFFPSENIVKTGNPVRKEVIDIEGKKDEAFTYFGLNKDRKTLLIVGGSQGALSVNKSVQYHLDLLLQNDLQIVWQTGKYFYETAREIAGQKKTERLVITEFIERMDYAYAIADVIISRAGAIAISEICAVAKPTIFVPLPSAAEDHQRKNAQALVDKKAALMIPDNETLEKLGITTIELINNRNLKTEFSKNLEKLAIRDASDRIADEVLKLVEKN